MSLSKLFNQPKPLKVIAVGAKDFSIRSLAHLLHGTFQVTSSRPGALLVGGAIMYYFGHSAVEEFCQPNAEVTWKVGLGAFLAFDKMQSMWKVGKGLRFSDYDPNSYRRRALSACESNSIEKLEELNQENPNWNWKGFDHDALWYSKKSPLSPLEKAIKEQAFNVIHWLLNHGALIEAPSQKYYTRRNKVKPESLRAKWIEHRHEAICDTWKRASVSVSSEDYPKLLAAAAQDKKNPLSTSAVLDSLFARADVHSSLSRETNILAIFAKVKDEFLPTQGLRQDLDNLLSKDNSLLLEDSAQELWKAIISHIEKAEFQEHFNPAQTPTASTRAGRL